MGFLKKFQDAKKEVTAEALKAEELLMSICEANSRNASMKRTFVTEVLGMMMYFPCSIRQNKPAWTQFE